ncbi:hypothetical protein C8R46DRAFT_1202310 [Mycena filopes]|nr:hypothetical protein C8R46DRAFT_1202310 [Mycena filopes]
MFSPAATSTVDLSYSPSSTLTSPTSSTGSSARSSPVHAASLVDPALHAPALMQLIDIKLDRHVIEYVVESVSETVDYALGRSASVPSDSDSSDSGSSPRGRSPSPYTLKFTTFVTNVLSRAEIPTPTVLTALVYVARARPHLSIALEEWALERVFLGALITASKYTNDSTLKNVHWALCTGVFGKRDVGRIEREFLEVLDWELGVSESDLLAHHEGLLAASLRSSALASRHTRSKTTAAHAHVHPSLLSAPRSQTHTRRHSQTAVPELEPSSPQSSAASMSPRTPSLSPAPAAPVLVDVPVKMDVDVHVRAPVDVPMDVVAPAPAVVVAAPTQTKHHHSKLHALLHAFPLPGCHHHQQQSRFAIHVNA